jgi:hypothetical protein
MAESPNQNTVQHTDAAKAREDELRAWYLACGLCADEVARLLCRDQVLMEPK